MRCRGNREGSTPDDIEFQFWKGGAGIYTGEGASLLLRDSTVRDNSVTGAAGGGVYGFFDSTVTIRSPRPVSQVSGCHQPMEPGTPLNGPVTVDVTHPP